MTAARPVVLVDMDGPLADFDARFFELCAANGWPMDCTLAEQRHRFATDHIPDRQHRDAARAMVDAPRWFLDLPVTPGAVEGLGRLGEVADVWICTKPLEANPTCRDDKAIWLAEHFGDEWVRRLIISPDKSMVRGDVLLDDAPHPDWLERALWQAVIFPTTWNGPGSKWETLPRWSWADDTAALLDGGNDDLLDMDTAMDLVGFNDLHTCGHSRGDHAAWRNRETWGFPCSIDGCDCEGTDLD